MHLQGTLLQVVTHLRRRLGGTPLPRTLKRPTLEHRLHSSLVTHPTLGPPPPAATRPHHTPVLPRVATRLPLTQARRQGVTHQPPTLGSRSPVMPLTLASSRRHTHRLRQEQARQGWPRWWLPSCRRL